MTRQIEIYISDEIKEEIDIRDENLQATIGYLSLWAIGSINLAKVHISVSSVEYMQASYTDRHGQQKFLMGAIFRDGKWEFHS